MAEVPPVIQGGYMGTEKTKNVTLEGQVKRSQWGT